MALGDISPFATPTNSPLASRTHQVTSGGTPPAILAGEPVAKTLGNQYVITLATNKPVVATDFLAGIAMTTSTETATAAGTVDVALPDASTIWVIAPKVAATFGQTVGALNQTTYNALVGARVLLDKTSGVYTILAADSSTSGLVIENLDITKTLGKVAFSFRAGCSYLT